MVEGADFLGGVAAVNLTPTQLAVIVGLVIAVLLGGLVVAQSLQSGTWQVQLVPAPESADASIPGTVLTPSAQSGTARLFAGFTNTPGGGFTYTFLQQDGLEFAVPWSTVRDGEAHITMPGPPLTNWTNPTACTTGVAECGHLAVAVPVNGPPGRPESLVLNGGAEEVIDASSWHRQHGELRLNGRQFFVILTDAGNIPAGSTISLSWLPWDGRGAPDLPAP